MFRNSKISIDSDRYADQTGEKGEILSSIQVDLCKAGQSGFTSLSLKQISVKQARVGFISVHQSFSSALNQDCILSARMRGRMKGPVARRFLGFANELSISCQARSVLKLVRFGPHHVKSQ